MSDAYAIEVDRKTIGLIVRRPEPEAGYRFLASLPTADSLEGLIFSGPYEAERAARAVLARKERMPASDKSMKYAT